MAKKKQKDEIQEEIIEQVEVNETEVIEEIIEKVVEQHPLFPHTLLQNVEVNGKNGIEIKKKGATIYLTVEGAKYFKQKKYIK